MTYEPPAPPPPGAQGAEPPPHFGAGYTPPPAPPRRGITGPVIAIVAAVVVLICGGCLVGGYFVAADAVSGGSASPSASPSPAPIAEGGCVTLKTASAVSARCDDPQRTGEVLELIENSSADAQDGQSCPAQSDEAFEEYDQVICVRTKGPEHAGAPGYGGGVIVAGDCVGAGATALDGVGEVPCAQGGHLGKAVKRVRAASECAAPAVRYAELDTARNPVVCLTTGPGFAGPGQCIHTDGDMISDFAVVSCTGTAATRKVLARTPSERVCPAATTHYIEDDEGLPRSKVVCLQELKGGPVS